MKEHAVTYRSSAQKTSTCMHPSSDARLPPRSPRTPAPFSQGQRKAMGEPRAGSQAVDRARERGNSTEQRRQQQDHRVDDEVPQARVRTALPLINGCGGGSGRHRRTAAAAAARGACAWSTGRLRHHVSHLRGGREPAGPQSSGAGASASAVGTRGPGHRGARGGLP